MESAGPFRLHLWRIECNDKNNVGKTTNFIIPTKSLKGNTVATTSLPIGDAFMSIERTGSFFGLNVFVKFDGLNIREIMFFLFIIIDIRTQLVIEE